MNEDLKPCYDIESCWKVVPEGCSSDRHVYRHSDYEDLFRIVDFRNQSITFNDTMRVPPENVIDIYRDIGLMAKGNIMGLVLRIMGEAKPITMPYVPEKLKVYIEYHKKAVGLLYYKDSDIDESIISIKRFFKIIRDPVLSFEEISWHEFYEIAADEFEEELKNVDKA